MPFTLKPHEFKKAGRGRGKVEDFKPYVRLKAGEDSPPIFIQNGEYYWEDGTPVPVKDLPDWVSKEVAKMTDQAKKECGLTK